MKERLRKMFGKGRKLERPSPDAITAQVIVARQRNERASQSFQELLEDKSGLALTVRDFVGKM